MKQIETRELQLQEKPYSTSLTRLQRLLNLSDSHQLVSALKKPEFEGCKVNEKTRRIECDAEAYKKLEPQLFEYFFGIPQNQYDNLSSVIGDAIYQGYYAQGYFTPFLDNEGPREANSRRDYVKQLIKSTTADFVDTHHLEDHRYARQGKVTNRKYESSYVVALPEQMREEFRESLIDRFETNKMLYGKTEVVPIMSEAKSDERTWNFQALYRAYLHEFYYDGKDRSNQFEHSDDYARKVALEYIWKSLEKKMPEEFANSTVNASIARLMFERLEVMTQVPSGYSNHHTFSSYIARYLENQGLPSGVIHDELTKSWMRITLRAKLGETKGFQQYLDPKEGVIRGALNATLCSQVLLELDENRLKGVRGDIKETMKKSLRLLAAEIIENKHPELFNS